MISLDQHLDMLSHRDLRGIATRLGLRSRLVHDSGSWSALIADAWRDEGFARRALGRLSPAALAALARLRAAGSLPQALFLAEYSAVRRAGAGRQWQPPPWRAPQGPAEELFYAGLLATFATPGAHAGPLRCAVPADLALPALLEPLPESANAPQADDTRRYVACRPPRLPAALLHDVGQWLIYLATRAPRLHSGRWLRPGDVTAFAARLLAAPAPNTDAPATMAPATMAHDPYLRFVAFLADGAHLIDGGRATAAGWLWLGADPGRQRADLWAGWLFASPDLRRAYHQPGAGLPAPWPGLLVDALPAGAPPAGGAFTPVDLTNRLLGAHPELDAYFQAHFPDFSTVDEAIAAELRGPLAALGVVQPLSSAHDVGAATADAAAADDTAPGPATITTRGEAPARQTVEVSTPWQAPLGAQAQLALFARYVESRHDTDSSCRSLAHVYELTPDTVARAAAAGHSLPSLLSALTRLAASDTWDGAAPPAGAAEQAARPGALTPALQSALVTWWRQGRRIELSPAPLLRTDTPALMAELHADPAIAPLLGELLAPTACLLAAPLAQVRAALIVAGHHPTWGQGSGGQGAVTASVDQPPPEAAPRDALVAWLAGQVYRAVGQHLPLPLPLPQAQLDTLWATFSAAEQDAASRAAAVLNEQLARLVDGVSYAPPEQPTDPTRWRLALEQAIASHASVELTYLTAGRNLLTRRTVEPYWIETHGGSTYLRAYCSSANRVRLFRLDRIQHLSPSPAVAGEGAGGEVTPLHTPPADSGAPSPT